VTTAIKNFDMFTEGKAETKLEVIKELEETETLFKSYMRAKTIYHAKKNAENLLFVNDRLKLVLHNIHETISEIWSLCDTEEEKETIKEYVKMYCEKTL
jgi:hypothetical protein